MMKDLGPGFRMMAVLTVITGMVYPAVVTGIAQLAFRDQANGSLIVSNGQVIGSRLIGQSFSRPEYFHPRPSSAVATGAPSAGSSPRWGGSGYDPTASSGSNLGPTSAKLFNGTTKKDEKGPEVVDFDGIKDRLVHFCVDNDIPYESSVSLERFKDNQGNLEDVKLIKAFNDEKAPLIFKATKSVPADAVTGSGSGLDPDISPENASLQAARIAKARGVTVDQVNRAIQEHTQGRDWGFLGEPHVNVLELNLALDRALPRR